MSLSVTNDTNVRRDSKANFFANMNGGLESSPLSQFVSDFSSTGVSLVSGFVGAVPRPQQLTGGGVATPNQHRSVRFYSHAVTPLEWGNTIDIDLATLEDARDSGVSSVVNIAGNMGAANAMHMLFRAQQVLILGNGTTVATAYAGSTFFAATHETGATGDNDLTSNITSTNNPTSTELETAIGAGMEAMLGFTDDQGKVYDHDINNFAFMFPPAHAEAAAKVLSPMGTLGGTAAGPGIRTDSAVPTGVFRGYEFFINGDMTDTDRFVILRRPRNGNVGPLIHNQRVPWDLITRDRASGSDYAIENGVVWHTSRMRGDIGYGDWRAAALHIFT